MSEENKATEEISEISATSPQTVSETLSQGDEEKFKELCHEMKAIHSRYMADGKLLNEKKTEFKTLAEKLGVTKFEDDDVRVSMTTVTSEYLDEEPTIEYLKQHGLEKYIHTKEFFIDEELHMAILKKEIDGKDLRLFMKSSQQIRVNIR